LNQQNLIKVLNPELANELVNLGFSYIKEQINSKDVFCFTFNKEILNYLQNNFNKRDFIFENTLKF